MTKEEIITILNEIPDPEIPVLSIIDIGIFRDVIFENQKIKIIITPTYSGCPAMNDIENSIIKKLNTCGLTDISVEYVFHPVWTTDSMSEETKEKLKSYGIAPPTLKSNNFNILNIIEKDVIFHCPYCNSIETKKTSEFGSTACKSLHFCFSCNQPFEHFKCH